MKRTEAEIAGAPSLERLEQLAHAPGAEWAAVLRWGWALYGAGRFSDAARAARECQALASGNPESSYLLGMALKGSGDRSGAAAAFNAAAADVSGVPDAVRGAMLRRLAIGQVNWLERGQWNLEPETWVRT